MDLLGPPSDRTALKLGKHRLHPGARLSAGRGYIRGRRADDRLRLR